MEQDARTLDGLERLEADVCIVGAGPAGITVAAELAARGTDILLLESGGPAPDPSIEALNDGTVIGDAAYAGLGATRARGIGGTTRLWNTPVRGEPGAKYAPLDAPDFEVRPGVPHTGWPFDRAHLEPFLRRAHVVCGLGRCAWDGAAWAEPERAAPVLSDARLALRVYQFGTVRGFVTRKLAGLRTAHNVRMLHHVTVAALDTDGRVISGVRGFDGGGRRLHVRARRIVLAGGAVENARLLLLSGGDHAPGNAHGQVGRCFMEHPRDYALVLKPRSARVFHDLAFMDAHEARDGTMVAGRLAVSDAALRQDALLNASVTLLPRLRAHTRSAGAARRALDRLRSLSRTPAREGYGWSAVADPAEVFDAFRLIINVEQRPDPANRIVLGHARDGFGLPRAELHWQWQAAQQSALERLRGVIAEALRKGGWGDVDVRADSRPDPNAHHHAGTTRMHADPRHGVVDADGRVHGTHNLFIAGASVFPTAGFANPTLTIVALALRLADHLAGMS